LATRVGGLDSRRRGRRALGRLGVDDRVIAALDAVRARVAVHREVAAADGSDRGIRVRRAKALLERADEAQGRRRRRVPSVEQRMDADARDTLATGQLDERDEMAVVGVDAARTDEADEVERASTLAGACRRVEEGR